MSTSLRFAYDKAFARNIGWFTEAEQLTLRGKCVAIAGMGGVGGVHLLTLARLGIGAFHIADFDTFDLANFNRQVGASMHTIGRPKVEVMEEMARDINPELDITRFDGGVSADNIDSFLEGVDLFIDGFDFFVLDMRRRVFARCAELGIPAVTAAPIGMGTAFLAFMPKQMTFEQYFRLEGQDENEQYLRFLMGLAPRGLHRPYLVDPSRLNLSAKIAPSTAIGCELSAGVTAVMTAKVLLRRGDLKPAPYHHHYDAYRGKLVVTRLNHGNAGPTQWLKLGLARRQFKRLAHRPPQAASVQPAAPDVQMDPALEAILSAARWAPSGDNDQGWRFEIRGVDEVVIHLHGDPHTNVYEYRAGEPILLAGGMLLESLRIAASAHGREVSWQSEEGDGPFHIIVRFTPTPGRKADPLHSYLSARSVNRWPYKMRPLDQEERRALEAALGEELNITWYQAIGQRLELARLAARATAVRLSTPEAFPTHQRIIDWERKLSPSGIPSRALGLHPRTLPLMRWSMQSWPRARLLNRLGSIATAALQMDYMPILASSAFFALRLPQAGLSAEQRARSILRAGQHIQRFWLTATRLGLAMQPALATLIFADYGEKQERFTADAGASRKAAALAAAFRRFFREGPSDFVFMGRIGEPRFVQSDCRSMRRPLAELVTPDSVRSDH